MTTTQQEKLHLVNTLNNNWAELFESFSHYIETEENDKMEEYPIENLLGNLSVSAAFEPADYSDFTDKEHLEEFQKLLKQEKRLIEINTKPFGEEAYELFYAEASYDEKNRLEINILRMPDWKLKELQHIAYMNIEFKHRVLEHPKGADND